MFFCQRKCGVLRFNLVYVGENKNGALAVCGVHLAHCLHAPSSPAMENPSTEWTPCTEMFCFRIVKNMFYVKHIVTGTHYRAVLGVDTIGAPVATRVELLKDALRNELPPSVLKYTLQQSTTATTNLTCTLHHTYRHAANPFVQSFTLHSYEVPTHVVTYNPKITNMLCITLATLPNVTHGKVLTCKLDDSPICAQRCTFRGVLNAVYARLPTSTGGRDLVRYSTLGVRTVPPEDARSTRGFRYNDRLGVSVQGADANKILVEVVRWCARLRLALTMELYLPQTATTDVAKSHTTPLTKMSTSPNDTIAYEEIGYIYLMHTRACMNAHHPVYKVGKTRLMIQDRLRGYDKGTRIHCVLPVDARALDVSERVVLQHLAKCFTRRSDYGREYFEGELGMMTRAMMDVLCG